MTEQISNSNTPQVMEPWKRRILFAFSGPIYLAASAALSRGIFALALPDLDFQLTQWLGVAIGGIWAAVFWIFNARGIMNWVDHGEWHTNVERNSWRGY